MSSYQPNFPFAVNMWSSPYEDDAITRVVFYECLGINTVEYMSTSAKANLDVKVSLSRVRLSARRGSARDRSLCPRFQQRDDGRRVGEEVVSRDPHPSTTR